MAKGSDTLFPSISLVIESFRLFVQILNQSAWKLRVLDPGIPSDIRAVYDFGPEKQGRILGKGQFGKSRLEGFTLLSSLWRQTN